MKTILILSITILISVITCPAQEEVTMDDIGRITLNSYIPEELNLPPQAMNLLENKLNQVSTYYGMGGYSIDGRFVIMAVINVISKDIIAGPPQMVAQNFEVTLYIGDAIENQLYSSATIPLKGVGKNENESLINGIKSINQRNASIKAALEEGKEKIIAYFGSNCDFIIRKALALSVQGEYDEAIYNLISVPEVCKECYFKCMDNLEVIHREKINKDCETKYNKAKALWAVAKNKTNAFEIADIIATIDPLSDCIDNVNILVSNINSTLREQERQEWEWKMKVYNDNLKFREADVDIEKMRIDAYRQIGVEQAKHIKRLKIKNKSLFGVNIGSGLGRQF